jgi:two-component system LytT family response regulator
MENVTPSLQAIIVDDEKRCVEMLCLDLEKHCPEVEVIGSFTSPKEALLQIKKLKPNLLFLDVEMPWMNGFELLELLGEPFFEVIFTTAYDRFAVKAFQFSAVDYLLKPVDPEELKKAVQKTLKKKESPLTSFHLETLMKNLKESPESISRIVLPTSDGYEFVHVGDILYCNADSNYTKLFFTNRKPLLISRSLKEMEQVLEGKAFFRIHQSHLVNLSHIANYTRGDGGYVTMSDGSSLNVARAKKEVFLNIIKDL